METNTRRFTVELSEKLYDQVLKAKDVLEAKTGLTYSTSDYVRMAISEKLLKGNK